MNEIKKQIKETEKSKDDSSRMFKAIKDLNKMKKRTQLLIKMMIYIQKTPTKQQAKCCNHRTTKQQKCSER